MTHLSEDEIANWRRDQRPPLTPQERKAAQCVAAFVAWLRSERRSADDILMALDVAMPKVSLRVALAGVCLDQARRAGRRQ